MVPGAAGGLEPWQCGRRGDGALNASVRARCGPPGAVKLQAGAADAPASSTKSASTMSRLGMPWTPVPSAVDSGTSNLRWSSTSMVIGVRCWTPARKACHDTGGCGRQGPDRDGDGVAECTGGEVSGGPTFGSANTATHAVAAHVEPAVVLPSSPRPTTGGRCWPHPVPGAATTASTRFHPVVRGTSGVLISLHRRTSPGLVSCAGRRGGVS